jgi:hypothetical protein
VKFKDSELVGFPIRIGIGEKSLAKGDVEIKPRAGSLVAVKAEEGATEGDGDDWTGLTAEEQSALRRRSFGCRRGPGFWPW